MMSISEAEKLIKKLDALCYHDKLLITEQTDIIHCLCQEFLLILMRTSEMSNNIDLSDVNMIVH